MYEVYKEVFLQEDVLAKTYNEIIGNKQEFLSFVKDYNPGEIVFIACGSSYWLSMSACLTMQRETGIRCSAVKSGDIVMDEECYSKAYRHPLVICPSRSGMTAETVIAAGKMKEWYGAKVLAITEYEKCNIDKVADFIIRIPWANEVSLMQTRSFSSLYLSCVLLSGLLGDNQNLLDDMKWYVENYANFAQNTANRVDAIVNKEYADYNFIVSLGTGCQYGVAVEGGYIQFEIAKDRADYFATLEYRHGPFLTNTDKSLFLLLSTGKQLEREKKVLSEIKAPGARAITISGNSEFEEADWNFQLGREIAPEAVAMYGAMISQGIAYYKAVRKGLDPDHPVESKDPHPFIDKV